MHKKLRLGMVGGGLGSMIGDIHRYAARLDNFYELVCGSFSRNVEKSRELGALLGLKAERVYLSAEEMFHKESRLPREERIEVVSIITPNDSHFAIAKAALQSNLHIIIEKPITCTLSEAKQLQLMLMHSDSLFCVTYTYAGYPMVKEAKQIIQSGKLGLIRKIIVEFMQGWLATYQEGNHNKQATWRMDAKTAISGTIADIGTHAFHLAEYITGLKAEVICADINKTIPERQLEDDGTIFIKYDNGAHGILIASQIAIGEEANINIRVYGEKGSLKWTHTKADTLLVNYLNQPTQIIKAGRDCQFLHREILRHCRTPSGHPEAYLEAFANHYRNFAMCINAKKNNIALKNELIDFPGIDEGMRGVAFIETVIAASKINEKWLQLLPLGA